MRHVLIGAQTPEAAALNQLARQSHALVDARPLRAVRSFAPTGEPPLGRRAFLSAMREMGHGTGLFDGEVLLPRAEEKLGPLLAQLDDEAALVLAIAPLDEVFLVDGSPALAEVVRRTPWERLYALSWVDIVEAVRGVAARRPLIVLTPGGLAARWAQLGARFFGNPNVELAPERPDREVALARLRDEFGLEQVTVELLQDRFAEDVEWISDLPRVELV